VFRGIIINRDCFVVPSAVASELLAMTVALSSLGAVGKQSERRVFRGIIINRDCFVVPSAVASELLAMTVWLRFSSAGASELLAMTGRLIANSLQLTAPSIFKS
jgi:hypothetical protein